MGSDGYSKDKEKNSEGGNWYDWILRCYDKIEKLKYFKEIKLHKVDKKLKGNSLNIFNH